MFMYFCYLYLCGLFHNAMIKLSHDTPLSRVAILQIGDEVIDSYETCGKIIKIVKQDLQDYSEFRLTLHNKQFIVEDDAFFKVICEDVRSIPANTAYLVIALIVMTLYGL